MAMHLTSSDCEGFHKKCCTYNAVDGSEEGWGCSECEEDIGTDCVDGDSDNEW
jgi:hypothetical protein